MYRQHFIGTKTILVQAPEIEHRLNEFIGATILAGYFDRLELIEKYDGTGIDFSAIIKLRAFTDAQELYIWRSNNVLKGRWRKDYYMTGDETEQGICIDTEMFIDKVLSKQGAVFEKYSKLKTRNYVAFDDNNQAYYTDMRLLTLIPKPNE